jgi:hypothetical protein
VRARLLTKGFNTTKMLGKLPDFDAAGQLPPGVHDVGWDEVVRLFGTTDHRRHLLDGLYRVLKHLAEVGCERVYLDGSFVTAKERPNDFDLVWDMDHVDYARLDPVLFQLDFPRTSQHAKFHGDVFPNVVEGSSKLLFVDFFQLDKNTGDPKGIVTIDLQAMFK